MSKAESESKTPLGVVGVYTDPEGRIIASVSDFKPDRPGGFTVYEAQRMRAKRKLDYAVVAEYCSPVIVAAIDDYDASKIVKNLKGKMTFIPVGHLESEEG